MTELWLAAEKGQLHVVKQLVAEGAEINSTSGGGRNITPLVHAVAKDRDDVVLWMLRNGADVHAVDHVGVSMLFDALEYGAFKSLVYLIAAGINVNARNGSDSPLSFLASLGPGHREAAAILVAAGSKGSASPFNPSPAEVDAARMKIENARILLKRR